MRDNAIHLLFSGDFAPILTPDEILENHFDALQPLLSEVDLHLTNLESPLTESKLPIPKTGPPLKATPDAIKLLKQARVNIACLANNHIYDYGERGLEDTLQLCKEHDIATIGIVHQKDNSPHYYIKNIKDKTIGIFNYCEHEFSVRERGMLGANGYDPIKLFYDIQRLRSNVDYLVVIYHGGNEYFSLPSPQMKKNFHYMIDLGADAVIAHHTHVISGYEIYNEKPLVYGLGNFFFPLDGEPSSWYIGLLCKLTLDTTIDINIHPIKYDPKKQETLIIEGPNRTEILNQVHKLSQTIATQNNLEIEWSNYVKQRQLGVIKQIPGLTILERVLLKIGIPFHKVFNKSRLLMLKNLLSCEAHYNLLHNSLTNKLNEYE